MNTYLKNKHDFFGIFSPIIENKSNALIIAASSRGKDYVKTVQLHK